MCKIHDFLIAVFILVIIVMAMSILGKKSILRVTDSNPKTLTGVNFIYTDIG